MKTLTPTRFQYNLSLLNGGSTTVRVEQKVNGVYQYLATQQTQTTSGTYELSFVPSFADIRISVSGTSRYALNNLYLDRDQIDTLVSTYALSRGYRYGSDSYRNQGQEKDDEAKGRGNSYYFGARMYDSRLGLWLTIDPLAAKYPNLSPYNFVGNSPLIFIDPDGRDIIIHYDSGERDSQGNIIMKQYIYGAKSEIPDNDFVRQTVNALNKIAEVDVSQYMNTDEFPTPSDMLSRIKNNFDSKVNIFESQSHYHKRPSQLDKSNMETNIYFNPYLGKYAISQDENGNWGIDAILDPASALNHELKHAFNYLYFTVKYFSNLIEDQMGDFPNAEEMLTTFKTDNDYNIYYCLGKRTGYTSIYSETSSSTSNSMLVDVTAGKEKEVIGVKSNNNLSWE